MNFGNLLIKYSNKYKNYLKGKSNILEYVKKSVDRFIKIPMNIQKIMKFLILHCGSHILDIAKRYDISISEKNYKKFKMKKDGDKIRNRKYFGRITKLVLKIAKNIIRKEKKNLESRLIIISNKNICNKVWKKIFAGQTGYTKEVDPDKILRLIEKYNPKYGDLIYCYPSTNFICVADHKPYGYYIFNGKKVIKIDYSKVFLNILDVRNHYLPMYYWINKINLGDIEQHTVKYDIRPYIDQMIANIQSIKIFDVDPQKISNPEDLEKIKCIYTHILDERQNKIEIILMYRLGTADLTDFSEDKIAAKVIKYKNILIKLQKKISSEITFPVTVIIEKEPFLPNMMVFDLKEIAKSLKN